MRRCWPPRTTEPRAAEPRAAEPRAAEPRAAEPRAAELRALSYAPGYEPHAGLRAAAHREHVHRDGAIRAADQRVDVERLEVVAELTGEGGDRDDRPGHGAGVGGRLPADTGQQPGHTQPA